MGFIVVHTKEDSDSVTSAKILVEMGAGDVIQVVARILAETESSLPVHMRAEFRGDFLETLNEQRKEAGL